MCFSLFLFPPDGCLASRRPTPWRSLGFLVNSLGSSSTGQRCIMGTWLPSPVVSPSRPVLILACPLGLQSLKGLIQPNLPPPLSIAGPGIVGQESLGQARCSSPKQCACRLVACFRLSLLRPGVINAPYWTLAGLTWLRAGLGEPGCPRVSLICSGCVGER